MGLIPKELEQFVIDNTKGSVEFAANKYQTLLLKGLSQTNNEIVVINSMFVNSFPRGFRKIYVKSFQDVINTSAAYKFINTSFLNLYGVRHCSKVFHSKMALDKEMKKDNRAEKIAYVGYSAFGESLDIIPHLKKRDPNIITCLILPDLPKCCMGNSCIYNGYLKAIDKKLHKTIKYIDKFVLFSKYMEEDLNIRKDRYIVIEGISDTGSFIGEKQKGNTTKKILYTGSLQKKYGICELLSAFRMINDKDLELHFCGSGDAEKEILMAIENDTRIKYHGRMKNKDVIMLQSNADMLINPRKNNGLYTKYSFPSKTMEYLLSGTPMLGYKLDGIPDDYDQFIEYVEGDSIESLSEKISEFLSLHNDIRLARGNDARQYILNYKNPYVQATRLCDFLKL